MEDTIEALSDKEKLRVLDDTVKVFDGECNSCGGRLNEISNSASTVKYIVCNQCSKVQHGDTFGEAYVLFSLRK